jgi:hypothetical protein
LFFAFIRIALIKYPSVINKEMGGGLLQLVAYGAQDAYLTGNPHITFWKILYKRHTNFAVEAFRVNFTGAPTYGQRVVAVVNRNADLVWKTYVEVVLPDMVTTPNPDVTWSSGVQRRLGYALLQQIEVEIGGQIIDRHYGEWLYLWETLTADFNTAWKLDNLVGGSLGGQSTGATACAGRPDVLYIPLQFWFNRNPGLALPLIALQYHEVRFNITLGNTTDLVSRGSGTITAAANALPPLKDMALYIDYVYLDVDERRRFAQESHEYLIEQLQYEGQQQITTASARLDLTLNHPIKELIWVFQDARYTDCTYVGLVDDPNTSASSAYTMPFTYNDIVNRARLQINGQDRFDERYGDYFWKVQPYQHHTAGGVNPNFSIQTSIVDTTNTSARDSVVQGRVNPINVYSFAIRPEEHQPSGTCNFSRIDNATLVFDSRKPASGLDDGTYPSKAYPYNFRLYAVNYNIFRIMSGMGGLAYSN